LAPRALEQPCEPADSGQHLQRSEVEVGALTSPRGDNAVDLVARILCRI
jgi:hypothetical protein